MKDPIRFLDHTSDADSLERGVLNAGFEAAPDRSMEDQILAKIMASAALVPAVAMAEQGLKSAGIVKTSLGLGIAKGFAVGLAICGAVSGAQRITAHFSEHVAPTAEHVALRPVRRPSSSNPVTETVPGLTPPPSALPVASAAPRAAVSALSATPVPSVAPPPSVSPSVAAFAEQRPVSTHASELEAEARALRDARAAMRAGQLTVARSLLEESSARFAAPALYQEREALMIELLYRAGETGRASQLARTFLDQFPESPHAARIRQLVALGNAGGR